MWHTSLSTDTLGIHLQIQKHMQNTAESGGSTLPVGRNIQNQAKLGKMTELGGQTRVLVGLDLSSAGGGTEAGDPSPHQGNCLSRRRNI